MGFQSILEVKVHPNISKDPEVFFQGLNMESIRTEDRSAMWYMILAARILYAQYWKLQKNFQKLMNGY